MHYVRFRVCLSIATLVETFRRHHRSDHGPALALPHSCDVPCPLDHANSCTPDATPIPKAEGDLDSGSCAAPVKDAASCPVTNSAVSLALRCMDLVLRETPLARISHRDKQHVYVGSTLSCWLRLHASPHTAVRRVCAYLLAVSSACGAPSDPRRGCADDPQGFLAVLQVLSHDPDTVVRGHVAAATGALPAQVRGSLGWSCALHQYFPLEFQRRVQVVCCVAQRLQGHRPPAELWADVLQYTTIDWFQATAEDSGLRNPGLVYG